MQKSRQALHALGYRNEELCPDVKAHIWKSVGAPSLLYSMCTGPLSTQEYKRLETFQGHMVKSALYLDKRAHHTDLLRGLNIEKIEHVINQQRVNLLRRVFKAPESSYSILCTEILSKYILRGVLPPGTLISNIANVGLSPLKVAFADKKFVLAKPPLTENGLRDSVRYVLRQHIKPGNEAHLLLRNLTRSF